MPSPTVASLAFLLAAPLAGPAPCQDPVARPDASAAAARTLEEELDQLSQTMASLERTLRDVRARTVEASTAEQRADLAAALQQALDRCTGPAW